MLPLSLMEMLTLVQEIVTRVKDAAQAPEEFLQLQRTLECVSELLSWIVNQDLTHEEEMTLRNWSRNCQECLTKTNDYLKAHVTVRSSGIVGFYARMRWTFADAKKMNSDLDRQMHGFMSNMQRLQTERR